MAVVEKHRDWLMPRFIDPESMMVTLCIQSYIIKTAHHTILVDTCVGNHKERPARPSWHMQDLPYLKTLKDAGVRAEEIDFVLCTHLHVDHVGWNTKLVDGRWVPTFPNAKYIFSRKEYETWKARYDNQENVPVPQVFGDSVLPIAPEERFISASRRLTDFSCLPSICSTLVVVLRSSDL